MVRADVTDIVDLACRGARCRAIIARHAQNTPRRRAIIRYEPSPRVVAG